MRLKPLLDKHDVKLIAIGPGNPFFAAAMINGLPFTAVTLVDKDVGCACTHSKR
jgi:hypothetical protein